MMQKGSENVPFMWGQSNGVPVVDLFLEVTGWYRVEILLKVNLNGKQFTISIEVLYRKNCVEDIFVWMVRI